MSGGPFVTTLRIDGWSDRATPTILTIPSPKNHARTTQAPLILKFQRGSNESDPEKRQSPIDIRSTAAIFDTKLTEYPLSIFYPRRLHDGSTLRNTGTTWRIDVKSEKFRIQGGPVDGTFILDQVHCHWGTTNLFGSEHTVDGRYFQGEMHFVHWNRSKYSSIKDCLHHGDGLAVIGVFLKVGSAHKELEKLTDALGSLTFAEQQRSAAVLDMDLQELLPKDTSLYWTYNGSLTTPPYSECVIWMVMKNPIEVSVTQLLAMRSLYRHKRDLLTADGEDYARLCHNFRPVQPHKATDVRVSFTLPDGHSCQQSPIDITTGATIYEPELRNRELVINYPETVRSPYKLINTGSTWKIYVPDRTYFLKGGPLYDFYYLEEIHAHWGETGFAGSEHLLDGRSFAGELHFVHWNRKYVTFKEALTKPDGIAVIAVFLEIGEPNEELFNVVDALDKVVNPGQTTAVRQMDINQMLPEDTSSYYTYRGSLTTAPFTECVTWIIMRDPISISREQLDVFRTLRVDQSHEGNGLSAFHSYEKQAHLVCNNRPVQRIRTSGVISSFLYEN